MKTTMITIHTPTHSLLHALFLLFAGVVSILFLTGCEETVTSESYRREVVISGTLTANRNIDTIKVSWTGVVDQKYDMNNLAITDAIVIVRGIDVAFYDSLIYDAAVPGRYYSTDPAKIILPTKTYQLTVRTTIPETRVVTAVTTVPDEFEISGATMSDGDTIRFDFFAPPNSFYWTASKLAATYLPTITYLDSGAALIPKIFYRDTLSKDFQKPEKVGYRIGLPPEQLNTELPWIFLSYYGNIQFDVYAIDNNYSDFINQYIPAQGGELREIRYKTAGGIGVFGSRTAAKNAIKIYLKP